MSRVYIRTEASTIIGFGHMKRCLLLAHSLKGQGVEPVFIVKAGQEVEGFENFIVSAGTDNYAAEIPSYPEDCRSIILDLSHRINLDAPQALKAYIEALVAKGIKVVMIDGLFGEDFYVSQRLSGAAAVVQPYLGAEKEARPDAGEWLCGAAYAMMEDAYQACPSKQIKEDAQNILLTFGGADPLGITVQAMEALKALDGVNIRVIVGPYFKLEHKEQIEAIAKDQPELFEVLEPQNSMISHYDWADLALSASGLSRYEFAAMGLPFVFAAHYSDHEASSQPFVEAGMARYLGVFGHFQAQDWALAVKELAGDQQARRDMSEAGQNTIDGKGAMRLTQKLLKILS